MRPISLVKCPYDDFIPNANALKMAVNSSISHARASSSRSSPSLTLRPTVRLLFSELSFGLCGILNTLSSPLSMHAPPLRCDRCKTDLALARL